MTLDGTYLAALDRITEDIATFLVEVDGDVADERHVPAEELPGGVSAGDLCRLTFEDGTLVGIEPSPEATEARRRRIESRFEDLSRRLGEE